MGTFSRQDYKNKTHLLKRDYKEWYKKSEEEITYFQWRSVSLSVRKSIPMSPMFILQATNENHHHRYWCCHFFQCFAYPLYTFRFTIVTGFLQSFSKSHAILLFATREWMLSPRDRILLLTHRIQEGIKMKNTPCFFQFPGQYELIHIQV